MKIEYTDFGLNIPGVFSLSWDSLTDLPYPTSYYIEVGNGNTRREATIRILTRSDRFVFLEVRRQVDANIYNCETIYKVGDYLNRVWS